MPRPRAPIVLGVLLGALAAIGLRDRPPPPELQTVRVWVPWSYDGCHPLELARDQEPPVPVRTGCYELQARQPLSVRILCPRADGSQGFAFAVAAADARAHFAARGEEERYQVPLDELEADLEAETAWSTLCPQGFTALP